MSFIYEISVTNDKGTSIRPYDEDCGRYIEDFEFTTKDILDIYDAVISTIVCNEIE